MLFFIRVSEVGSLAESGEIKNSLVWWSPVPVEEQREKDIQ